MPDKYASDATKQLIAEIGSSVDMVYTENGSYIAAFPMTPINKVVKSYDNNFGYSAILADHNSNEVCASISNNKPVHMRGFTDQIGLFDGHAWVCDGFKSNQTEYQYFIEYLNTNYPNTYFYDSYGETFIDLPGYFTRFDFNYSYYHMNWGWYGNYDGWYSNVDSGSGNYKYNRSNTYVTPKI